MPDPNLPFFLRSVAGLLRHDNKHPSLIAIGLKHPTLITIASTRVHPSVPWISWLDALCRVGRGFRLRVGRSQLGEIRTPLPSLDEQLAIRECQDSPGKKCETVTAEVPGAIDLLQKRRTMPISAASIGRIFVHGLANALAETLLHAAEDSAPYRARD